MSGNKKRPSKDKERRKKDRIMVFWHPRAAEAEVLFIRKTWTAALAAAAGTIPHLIRGQD